MVLSQLPEAFHPDSRARLELWSLAPIMVLQSMRFQLYRRSLSPVCSPPERGAAVTNCATVAHETAKVIQRAMQTLDAEKHWIRRIASNMMCLHLWRCILMLCLQKDFQAALVLVGASAAIGDTRKINTACGKNLVFFLEQLAERSHRRDGNTHQPVEDEEMIAYASGDLQSSLEHSWAWAGASGAQTATSPHSAMQNAMPSQPGSKSSDAGTGGGAWAGWETVEQMLKEMLMGAQQRLAAGPTPTYYPPPHNPMKRVQLGAEAPGASSPKPPTTPSNASRISIANII